MTTNEKTTYLKLFFIPFCIAFILGAIVVLAEFNGVRSQIVAIPFIPVALLSLPWSYPLEFIRQDTGALIGIMPAAFLNIFIIAIGLSINVILFYTVFFSKKWRIDIDKRIKLAQYLIYLVIVMTVLAGLFLGWIFPHLGGHGPMFSWLDLPFILVGGLVGCSFAYLSLLAARMMPRTDDISHTYIYAWSAVMIVIGLAGLTFMSSSTGATPLLVAGLAGVVVLFTKRAQRMKVVT